MTRHNFSNFPAIISFSFSLDLYKFPLACPNIHNSAQICPNIHNSVQICPNMPKFAPDLSYRTCALDISSDATFFVIVPSI